MAGNRIQNESELIKACKRDDSKAQRQIYEHYAPLMLSVCVRYMKSTDAAHDVLQDGFVKVFTRIRDFREQGSFEGWVRRIFVNTALETLRKRDILAFAGDASEMDIHDEDANHAVSQMSADEIIKLIAELPPGYRTVFNLFAIEGYSHEEIAAMLNVNVVTSRSQFSRARKILQDKVKNHFR